MIVYEYKCSECNLIIEKSFPMGEAPSTIECILKNCKGEAPMRFNGVYINGNTNSNASTRRRW